MLKILKDSQILTDRYTLKVTLNNFQSKGENGCFVMSADSVITSDTLKFQGMFAGYTNKKFNISGKNVVVEFVGLNFPRTIVSEIDAGNPGDLSYIDGCSNSIIVPPPRNGEPCLNYLYFPPGIMQTQHTHPSLRLGLVLSGNGKAHTPDGVTGLTPGDIFLLERHTLHNFSTDNNNHMSLVVFHPDSDSGPTDEFNPMKTRTFIQK